MPLNDSKSDISRHVFVSVLHLFSGSIYGDYEKKGKHNQLGSHL